MQHRREYSFLCYKVASRHCQYLISDGLSCVAHKYGAVVLVHCLLLRLMVTMYTIGNLVVTMHKATSFYFYVSRHMKVQKRMREVELKKTVLKKIHLKQNDGNFYDSPHRNTQSCIIIKLLYIVYNDY